MRNTENRCDYNTTIENADYFVLDDYNAGITMNMEDIYEVLKRCSVDDNILTTIWYGQLNTEEKLLLKKLMLL